jgi:hypothetical protein
MKQFLNNVKLLLKPIGNWALFTMSVVSAFCIGYYYTSIKTMLVGANTKRSVAVMTSAQCTVSVTDRGELLILNRSTGTFDLYEDRVGAEVFKAYGRVVTSNITK